MQETLVGSLGQKDPVKKEMATHSSILAWEIPRTEEPDGLCPLMYPQNMLRKTTESVRSQAAFCQSTRISPPFYCRDTSMSIPLTKPSPCFSTWHSGHTTVGLAWGLPNLICLLVSTRAPDSQRFLVRPPPLAPTSSPPCSAHPPLVPTDPAQPQHPPRPHPVVGDNLSNSQSLSALRSCLIESTAFQVDFVLHLLVSF